MGRWLCRANRDWHPGLGRRSTKGRPCSAHTPSHPCPPGAVSSARDDQTPRPLPSRGKDAPPGHGRS